MSITLHMLVDTLLNVSNIELLYVTYAVIVKGAADAMKDDSVSVSIPWSACRSSNKAGVALVSTVQGNEADVTTEMPSGMPSFLPTSSPTTWRACLLLIDLPSAAMCRSLNFICRCFTTFNEMLLFASKSVSISFPKGLPKVRCMRSV